MIEQDETQKTLEAKPASYVLASKPISELQGLNEIRFAVWEMLDSCYPWSEDTPKFQERPSFCLTAEQRNEFIRLQINAHNRNSPLIWRESMVLESDQSNEWVEGKIGQIEKAFLNKDELATIENLCTPYAGGKKWPLRGRFARWQLYAQLFKLLMMKPPASFQKDEVILPVSDLLQVAAQLGKQIGAPLREVAEFAQKRVETCLYGRPLTPQERTLKAKQQAQQWEQNRQQYELQRYGQVLDPVRRKQALRNEELERAEKAAHEAKLRALDAERIEALERAKGPLERTQMLKDKNRLLLTEMRKEQAESILKKAAVRQKALNPGENRTLEALRKVYPEGFTVHELSPRTKKDDLAEETPSGSLGAWLKSLERKGLVRANTERPKKWFFVKDYKA